MAEPITENREEGRKHVRDHAALRIGTAGWSIPTASSQAFTRTGTHLERYAAVMPAVEINSSFYRPHRRVTYERWAASTPEDFRFSVKLPKEISHVRRLIDADAPLDAFIDEIGGLGSKLGVVLVQLPPSLAFDGGVTSAFLKSLGARLAKGVAIACEPRHATWFTEEADTCLVQHRVARVVADPAVAPGGERPAGWAGLRYFRLHGSPRIYYSRYDSERLAALAETVAADQRSNNVLWCIFDNTAAGAAIDNALSLKALLG